MERAFNSVVPFGMTPTKTKINVILTEYLNKLNGGLFHRKHWMQMKPLNLIVITDGAPYPECECVIAIFLLTSTHILMPTIIDEDPTPAIKDCMKKLDRLGIPKNYRQASPICYSTDERAIRSFVRYLNHAGWDNVCPSRDGSSCDATP